MAADAALKVVKQIQGLADGPKTQEMRECLGHVVSSLQFFLDHPDSRVRLSSARAMAKLASGYPEEFKKLDLTKAKAAFNRCNNAVEGGNAEHDVIDLHQLLSGILRNAGVDVGPASEAPAVAPAPEVDAPPVRTGPEDRGEVVLKIGESCENRAAILDVVVKLQGVVSVTVEGIHVVVNTRTREVAADSDFLVDLLGAVKAQANGQKVEVVTGANPGVAAAGAEPSAAEDDEGEPQYLDDDEEDEVVFSADAPAPGFGAGAGFGIGGGMGGGFGGGYRPPMGLAGGIGGGMGGPGGPGGPGGQQWSFFAQSNWMTGRRVQEHQDDPAIVARLAKAKKKEDDRIAEEKSRLNKLSSWFGRR